MFGVTNKECATRKKWLAGLEQTRVCKFAVLWPPHVYLFVCLFVCLPPLFFPFVGLYVYTLPAQWTFSRA